VPGEHIEQLFFQGGAGKRPVDEIWTVEAAHELERLGEAELSGNILSHPPRGSCGIGVDRDAGQKLFQPPQLSVLRSEIVPPLADAVCLVDCNEADLERREQRSEAVRTIADEAFGRDIEQLESSIAQAGDHRRLFCW
jgi:hypothetical protein